MVNGVEGMVDLLYTADAYGARKKEASAITVWNDVRRSYIQGQIRN